MACFWVVLWFVSGSFYGLFWGHYMVYLGDFLWAYYMLHWP